LNLPAGWQINPSNELLLALRDLLGEEQVVMRY
jgi:hypothetical protein